MLQNSLSDHFVALFWFVFLNFFYQNFLFKTKDADSQLKAIDFGLSEFVKPGQ